MNPDAGARRATERTRKRYDRIARTYDLMEWAVERRAFGSWRPLLWDLVEGPRVLEVGVGTGKNLAHYPADAEVTAIDFSPGMLAHARRRAAELGSNVELREMDVQHLDLPDDSFDTVVTTFVFCSVPDPVLGLREIARVLRPGGRLLMLEHVLSMKPVLRQVMRAADPMVVRMMGANITRRTRNNIEAAGFLIEKETDLWLDIVKLFQARHAGSAAGSTAAPTAESTSESTSEASLP
ncbi:MAG: class I SAM-dependent methyltransferase [Actinobacteria bacterium]|nr:class I SAM-dependent methyltransferase [Actinomycetota bacterium]